MKHLKLFESFLLLERTTLTNIGIPLEIVQQIEKDYEFSNVDWKKVNLQELLKYIFINKSSQSNLFLQILPNKIMIFTSVDHKDHRTIIYDEFIKSEDDFGEMWERKERKDFQFVNVINRFDLDYPIYYLEEGEFKIEPRKLRKLKIVMEDFDNTTKDFKQSILDYINKYEIDWIDKDGSSYDSLDDIERMIIRFETKLSQRKKKFLQLPEIINIYGMDKVKTSFLFFLKTGKIILK